MLFRSVILSTLASGALAAFTTSGSALKYISITAAFSIFAMASAFFSIPCASAIPFALIASASASPFALIASALYFTF